MNKKLFLTILLITLISTILAGCSSASNEDKIPKNNKTSIELTAEEAESQKNQYVEWMKRDDRLEERLSTSITVPVEEYIGLGVSLGCSVPVQGALPEDLMQIGILEFLPNSPARACGFKEDDEIISIDEFIQYGDINQQIAQIKASVGHTITINGRRDGNSFSKTLKIEKITANPITYQKFSDVGYIRLEMFNACCPENFANALKALNMHSKDTLILDLRGTQAGYPESFEKTANFLLPKGAFLSSFFMQEGITTHFVETGTDMSLRVLVLTNWDTSREATALACALKNAGIGTIIGEETSDNLLIHKYDNISTDLANIHDEVIGTYWLPGYDINSFNGLKPDIMSVEYSKREGSFSSYTSVDNDIIYSKDECGAEIGDVKEYLTILGYGEFDDSYESWITLDENTLKILDSIGMDTKGKVTGEMINELNKLAVEKVKSCKGKDTILEKAIEIANKK